MTERVKLGLLACVLPLLGLVLFSSTGHDDSYITYWSARCLAESGRICNFNGQLVEQSSTLGYTIMLAVVHRLTTISIPALGSYLSIGFGILTAIYTGVLARLTKPRRTSITVLVVVLTTQLVYWTFGGMETTATSFAILGVLVATRAITAASTVRRTTYVWFALAISAFVTMRPEAPMVAVGYVIVLAAVRFTLDRLDRPQREAPGVAREPTLVLITIVIVAVVCVFRLLYFGKLFPQPVYAKTRSISPALTWEGLRYVRDQSYGALWIVGPLWLAAGVQMLRRLRRDDGRDVLWPAFVLSSIYIGFVIISGGDWMFGGRFLVPIIPPIVVVGIAFLFARSFTGARRVLQYSAVVAALVLNGFSAFVMWRDGTGMPFWQTPCHSLEKWRDLTFFERHNIPRVAQASYLKVLIPIVDRVLPLKPKLVIASKQAGFAFYYLAADYPNRFEFIDPFGLVEPTVTDCSVTASFPHGTQGVELGPEYLRLIDQIHDVCGVEKPDLIHDCFWDEPEERRFLDRAGYTVVALHRISRPGFELQPGGRRFPPRAVCYVAIRNDWAPLIPASPEIQYTFPDTVETCD